MTAFLGNAPKATARDEPRYTVEYDEIGLKVFEGGTPCSRADWTEIKEIFAYKDDLWAYDEICIGFRIDDAGGYCWISESHVGYRELVESLKERFPAIRTDWFSDVAFPAFAQNRTTLWGVPQILK